MPYCITSPKKFQRDMRNFHTPISKYNKPLKNLCRKCTKCEQNHGISCAKYIFINICGFFAHFFLIFPYAETSPMKAFFGLSSEGFFKTFSLFPLNKHFLSLYAPAMQFSFNSIYKSFAVCYFFPRSIPYTRFNLFWVL